MASMFASPRTVEEIFKDHSARRSALVRALTTEADEVYIQCDPEKENLCLYGHPTESWEVTLPAEEVPPELPEPALGINFARDGMSRKDWLSLVAVHSDCWLLSMAFYFGARLNRNERLPFFCELGHIPQALLAYLLQHHFEAWLESSRRDFLNSTECVENKAPQKRLFSMINDLPTLFEIVTGRKPVEDKPSAESGSKSKNNTKRAVDGQARSNSKLSYVEDEDEHGDTICGSCEGNYNADEFWIGCDICERWYHGKCVKITPAKAESIKQYKCPSCSTKKTRH